MFLGNDLEVNSQSQKFERTHCEVGNDNLVTGLEVVYHGERTTTTRDSQTMKEKQMNTMLSGQVIILQYQLDYKETTQLHILQETLRTHVGIEQNITCKQNSTLREKLDMATWYTLYTQFGSLTSLKLKHQEA